MAAKIKHLNQDLLAKKQEIYQLEADFHAHKIPHPAYFDSLRVLTSEASDISIKIAQAKHHRRNTFMICLGIILASVIPALFLYRYIIRLSVVSAHTETVSYLAYIPDPIQTPTDREPIEVEMKDYTARVEFLASYILTGRVLHFVDHRFSYQNDVYADLSPVDLFIAWGVGTKDSSNLVTRDSSSRYVAYSCKDASDAWCLTKYDNFIKNTSNTHFIPASDDIRARLQSVRNGDYVRITGYLVGVYSNGVEPWVSSLSRNDVHYNPLVVGLGGKNNTGACEIMYVEDLVWLK